MHSLPSRRRLPQPNFFRFKCYRLSPLPFSFPPPSLPAPAPPLPRLLPISSLRLVSASAHSLARTLTPGAVDRQGKQTHPHTPGPVGQAGAQLDDGAVGRQGRRTFTKSANRDLVITPSLFISASSRAVMSPSSHASTPTVSLPSFLFV